MRYKFKRQVLDNPSARSALRRDGFAADLPLSDGLPERGATLWFWIPKGDKRKG